MRGLILALALLAPASPARDGERDNDPKNVRPVPAPGVPLPADIGESLERGLSDLAGQMAQAKKSVDKHPALAGLLPDVEVYHKAVRYAVLHGEFFHNREFAVAEALIK